MSDRNKRIVTVVLGILACILMLVTWVFMEPNVYRIPALVFAAPIIAFAYVVSITGSFHGALNVAFVLVPEPLRKAFRSDRNDKSS